MHTFKLGLLAAGLGLLLTASCKKSDSDTAPYAKLQFSFSNEAGGKPIELGPMNYVNAAGNAYSVDLLKYYVSNITLVKQDGSEVHFPSYNLIDAAVPSSTNFAIDSVPTGTYRSLKFYVGVDSARNHTGLQEGALDPVHGMIWNWNTGYIFFKHEGSFKDSTGATMPLAFHYGTDLAYVGVEIPLNDLQMEAAGRKLFIRFDLNQLYATPIKVDFNFDNNRSSGNAGDVFWQYTIRGNFPSAFSLIKSE